MECCYPHCEQGRLVARPDMERFSIFAPALFEEIVGCIVPLACGNEVRTRR